MKCSSVCRRACVARSRSCASRKRAIPSRPCASWSAFRPAPRRTSRRASSPTSWRRASGKPVVVENVSGASGNIACDRVAKAPPDGYTLVMCGNGSLIMSASLYDKLPFDPVKDFVADHADLRRGEHPGGASRRAGEKLAELVALAKAKPGELTYGHTGAGTSQHLAGELFKCDGQGQHPADRLSRLDRGAARPARRAHHDGLHQRRQRRAAGEATESCAPSRSRRASARRWRPTCRPWRSRVIPDSRRCRGSA